VIAEIEILSAEAETASRRAEILEARALLENSRDELASTISLGSEDDWSGLAIRAGDDPCSEEKALDPQEAWRQALANRPDFLNTGIALDSKSLELGYAKNQMLPALNINAQYWSPGLSGTQIRYRDDNPLTGDVIGIIPGAAGDALRNALEFGYRNWAFYLTLDVPLRTAFSRGAYAAARMERREAQFAPQRIGKTDSPGDLDPCPRRSQRLPAHPGHAHGPRTGGKEAGSEVKRQAAGLTTSYTSCSASATIPWP